MNAGTAAALGTAVFAFLGAVFAAFLSYRGQRSSAKADTVAAQFEAYDELVNNLRKEVERLHGDVTAAKDEAREAVEQERHQARTEINAWLERSNRQLDECEHRCQQCRAEVGDLHADLAALRAIVRDEVVRDVAADAIARAGGDPEVEARRVRDFIRRLPPDQRPEEPSP